MGATHSHVCRAHSLFKNLLTNLHQKHKSTELRRAKISARLFVFTSAIAWSTRSMHHLKLLLTSQKRASEIFIGFGISEEVGSIVKRLETLHPRQVVIVSNKRVFGLYGAKIKSSLKREGFNVTHWLMSEGERHKSFRSLERSVQFLSEQGLERNDVVLALGGGVVGDLAGFAAAVYLRGVPVVQLPTTLLAQIDSSVGGKTAINLSTGKNLVGAFHQPDCVVIDLKTLSTLPQRELVAGHCEMVKQALISDKELFEQTTSTLKKNKLAANTNARTGQDRSLLHSEEFENLVSAHCGFKASIVAEDERESTSRSDRKSRKILNFGHTTAHALESLTQYREFRHGEAVGYGVLVAGQISKHLGLITNEEVELLNEAVALCGPLPPADTLDVNKIMKLVRHDKKSVNGEISWVLLEGIGLPKIVKGNEISPAVLRHSLHEGLRRRSSKKV